MKEAFFTGDRSFYKSLFAMLIMVALQNIVAYSVNMADNLMLGSYSQGALSGAATVNQIFFMVQQITLFVGDSLIVLGAQYWGKKDTEPIRKLSGIVLRLALICAIVIFILCAVIPRPLMLIFTTDEVIIREGMRYLSIIKYTFVLFILSNVLMAILRSVETFEYLFIYRLCR